MYRWGIEDERNVQKKAFFVAYKMGEESVMYNVPLYKIVVNRMRKFIKNITEKRKWKKKRII